MMSLHPTRADLASLYTAQLRRARKAARNAKGFVKGTTPPPLVAGNWVIALVDDPATGLKTGAVYQVRAMATSMNPACPGVPVALLEGFPLQGARIGRLVFDGYRPMYLQLTDAPERKG